jgi:hypothetical protein
MTPGADTEETPPFLTPDDTPGIDQAACRTTAAKKEKHRHD